MTAHPVIVQTIANRWSKRSRASSPLADTFNLPALPSSAAGKALLWHAIDRGPHDGPSREALRSYDAISKSFELVAIEPNGPGTISLFVDGREIATVEPGRTAGVLYSYAQDLPAVDWDGLATDREY